MSAEKVLKNIKLWSKHVVCIKWCTIAHFPYNTIGLRFGIRTCPKVKGMPVGTETLRKANSHFDPTQTGSGNAPPVEADVDWYRLVLLLH